MAAKSSPIAVALAANVWPPEIFTVDAEHCLIRLPVSFLFDV